MSNQGDVALAALDGVKQMTGEDLTKKTSKELASTSAQPGSLEVLLITLEFARRQTVAQQRVARYLLWLVIVMALSAVATLIVSLLPVSAD